MKVSPIIFFAMILSTVPCLARLGENRERLNAIYGRPVSDDISGPNFKKDGILIETVIDDSKAEVMTYQKTEKDSNKPVKMTVAEIKTILADNIKEGAWVNVREGVWGHKAERKAAFYDTEENRLYVCTYYACIGFERSLKIFMRFDPSEKALEKWERIRKKTSMMYSWWS
jgi:hypothetical protein